MSELADRRKDMRMIDLEGVAGRPYWCRSALVIFAGAVLLGGSVLAQDKPVDAAPGAGTARTAPRVSPYVLAAQRRAQEEGDASQPRIGLQAQMQKNAVRRHLAPARPGT
jgi:hypothetical protein